MTDPHFAIIEQLIAQNEMVKEQNRKLTALCQDILDDYVDIFKQFFPSIRPFDSDTIYSAGEGIFLYYKKQLLLYKAELIKNLLQIANIYQIEIEGQLQTMNMGDWSDFLLAMKTGKGGMKDQLNEKLVEIEKMQTMNAILQKEKHDQQLQTKQLSIELHDKLTQIDQLKSTLEVLKLENQNLTKLLMRAKHDFESLEGEFKAIETELDAMKFINLELKRQVMSLDKEKIYNLDTSFYLGTNK